MPAPTSTKRVEALAIVGLVQLARPTEDEFRENIGTGAIALQQLGADLLSTFETRWAAFINTLSRLQSEDWNLLAAHAMGSEPMPIWVDIRITEHAMHGWDIRSSSSSGLHMRLATISSSPPKVVGINLRMEKHSRPTHQPTCS